VRLPYRRRTFEEAVNDRPAQVGNGRMLATRFYVQVRTSSHSDMISIKDFRRKIRDNLRQPRDPSSAVGTVHMLIKNQVLLSDVQPPSLQHTTRILPAAVSPSPFILIMFSSIVPSDWPACLIDLTSGFLSLSLSLSLSKLHINWEELWERRQLLFIFLYFSYPFFVPLCVDAFLSLDTFVHKCERVTGLLLLAHDYQSVFPSFSLES
jgi:hypothetical protein